MSKTQHQETPSLIQVVATQIFFIFTPILGQNEPILTNIFFKWVETTNSQRYFINAPFDRCGKALVFLKQYPTFATWMSKEGSNWLVNGYNLHYKWGILGWNNPLILIFDPNFQRDMTISLKPTILA